MERDCRRQQGFSLPEVLLCLVLLSILIPAMVAGFTAAYMTVNEARLIELAKTLAQLKMEEKLADDRPLSEPLGSHFDRLPGFTYGVQVTDEGILTAITVTISYRYLGMVKDYKAVAWRAKS